MLFFHSLIWCNCKETEKHIEHALKLYKMSPNKVEIIAGIGVEMFQYHNQIALKKFCEQVKLSVKWWKIVKNYDINYNKFFKVDSKERLQLMLQTDNFCAKQIKEYCTDFNLGEIQTYYLIYLRTVLLNWKPKYEITTNCAGKRVLAMEENQDQQLFQKCKKIISLIEDKVKVEKMLQELWSQVNFYHYEVFMCILDISEQHTHVHLEYMLHFLKGYNRINAPGDTEQETWFSAFPESLSIDPLSEFRVLFNTSILDSKDIWNIIRKEISLKNYDVWFSAVEAFNHLTVDDVCSYLVKELVAQGVLKTIKPGDWFHTQQTSLFTEIDNCLQHMDNEEMKKTTAAYCLLCNTPEGADQVTIAKITYRYAQEYRNAEPDSCKSISFTKVEKKYQRCLSLQILHKNKLADQIYLDLILNIDQLLEALYQDVRIIKRAEHVDPYCPDINKAADELAEVFGSDIVAFRKKLIVDCLLDSNLGNSSSEMSSIFCRNLNIVNKDQSTSSENNLKRAAYICLSNLKFWQEYLFRVGYVSDDSNFFLRSRALKCLLAISNSETIQKLTTLSMESFMKIIENLTLSSITSKFSLQVDSNQSWKNITKKLAQIGNPDSIRALAEVCMLLKISQVNYWEYIIVNAEHFGMFSALRKYLEFTETQDYRYEKFYIRTWESLIDHSINTSLNMREEEMEKACWKIYFCAQMSSITFTQSRKIIQ
ncbi:hypothetical protein HHI36_002800 [Cryptolaemus montrouzieri]|uniref:Uncharacterized protein n=1 Tax=Cryptolaemus montrouzieri TaxID=559131 RepID=A0ABD2PBM2_9CUCU